MTLEIEEKEIMESQLKAGILNLAEGPRRVAEGFESGFWLMALVA